MPRLWLLSACDYPGPTLTPLPQRYRIRQTATEARAFWPPVSSCCVRLPQPCPHCLSCHIRSVDRNGPHYAPLDGTGDKKASVNLCVDPNLLPPHLNYRHVLDPITCSLVFILTTTCRHQRNNFIQDHTIYSYFPEIGGERKLNDSIDVHFCAPESSLNLLFMKAYRNSIVTQESPSPSGSLIACRKFATLGS